MKLIYILFFSLLFFGLNGQALSGTVINSSNGEPLAYVNIIIVNSTIGTITDADGTFRLNAPKGINDYQFSILSFEKKVLRLNIIADTIIQVEMNPSEIGMSEVTIEAKKTKIGNAIIKKLIANKDKILTDNSTFSNDNYIKTQMERWREASSEEDTIVVLEGFETVYLSEVATRQHYSNKRFKGEVKGELINSTDNELQRNARMDVERDFRGSNQQVSYNPIEFFRNSQEANIELYENMINNATLSDRPITSPLGPGAFINYKFRLKEINVVGKDSIFRVSVEPIFKKAPLFNGDLVVNGTDWVLISADLKLDNNVISAFNDFNFIVKYEKVGDEKWKAVDRSFFYSAFFGKKEYKVNTQIIDSNFDLEPEFEKNFFSNEIIKYSEEALERDTTIWETLRPKSIHVSGEERKFIFLQDSVWNYEHSDEYYMAQDSDYNKITIINVLWSGVNYRKRAKGLTFGFNSLAQSVRLFGVGGYRQSLGGYVEKEFPSSNSLGVNYGLNYGFANKDLKGNLRVGYTYYPQKFSRLFASVGDTYDLITVYESLQNIISKGNFIRNKRFSVGHVFEVVNGLYLTGEMKYADKQSIEGLNLADWTDFIFGESNTPTPFERYRSFILDIDLTYKFNQKYITRGRKKIILGNNYPTLNLKYIKGIPNIWNSEVNFDHLEIKLSQEMPSTKLGNTNWVVLAGKFLNTNSLRFIEYKYFRGSTPYIFADPLRDYQLLGPTLSTNNAYIQGMAIHHFNGFIMDKIPGINWLQLELIVGGETLAIPDQEFFHLELFAGLGRKFTFRGEQFQIAAYATTADNTIDKLSFSYKIGFNFYNAFTGKWIY